MLIINLTEINPLSCVIEEFYTNFNLIKIVNKNLITFELINILHILTAI